MKNLSSIVFTILVALVASPVYASSITFSPATVSVTAGQTFTVAVSANPQGTKLYTVKAEVSYPAALLEATGFTFGSGWMPLPAAGYDSTDNTVGKLVKTGGFPGGFVDTKALGTITFKAKADGVATISTGGATLAYDAQSKNTISGSQGASVVTVGAPASTPEPTPPSLPTTPAVTSVQKTSQVAKTPAATKGAAGVTASTSDLGAGVTSTPTTTEGQIAAAAAGLLLNIKNLWWWLLLILLLTGGWWAWKKYKEYKESH